MFAPGSRQNLIPTGNETLDRFLGGGLLNSSLNLFERQGPNSRILDVVINRSVAIGALVAKKDLLYVNFNTSVPFEKKENFKFILPSTRKIRTDQLYKDIRSESKVAKIKIAWRYSNQGTPSPTDGVPRVDQVDFGLMLKNSTTLVEDIGKIEVMNVGIDESLGNVISSIRKFILERKEAHSDVVIIIQDLLHPFSPVIDSSSQFIRLLYALRCLSRLLTKGAIVVSYDRDMCMSYSSIQQQLFNIADSVVSFYSYETGENLITGYKDIDGTLSHIKVSKINSFGFHSHQGLSDWGYRITKNNRFFMVDELSLPPCDDDKEEQIKNRPSMINPDKTDNTKSHYGLVSSLEKFCQD